MKEQFPKSIFLHDGQTEVTWSDSAEVGGVDEVVARLIFEGYCKQSDAQ